jgi:hypothetical protein
MAVSAKVTNATVGASVSTMILGILGPHIYPSNLAPDVAGLVNAGVTALVTLGAGWLTRDVLPTVEKVVTEAKTEVAKVEGAYSQVRQSVPELPSIATVETAAKSLVAAAQAQPQPVAVAVPVAQPLQ